jgi:hypothetical protein
VQYFIAKIIYWLIKKTFYLNWLKTPKYLVAITTTLVTSYKCTADKGACPYILIL